jgi:transcriptional antiterminator NusG
MSLVTPETSAAWYAVCTRARHEQVVRQQLLQKGIDTFLPTTFRWSRWKDRRKKVEWPLFSGYCFARFDPTHTLPVLRCAGVLHIVSTGGKLAVISEEEITSLRVLMDSQVSCDPCPFIREGTAVEVVSGPLRGVTGLLLTKNGRTASVVLSVESVGQAVRVQVDAADIDVR